MKSVVAFIKSHYKLLIFIILGLIFVAATIILIIIFNTHEISYKLIGIDDVSISVGKVYVDDGFEFKEDDKVLDTKLLDVSKESNVDTNKLGEYEVKYIIKHRRKVYELIRKVKVIDDIKPVIEVNVNEIKRDYCTKEDITKLEYSVTDNYDGDITKQIVLTQEVDSYTISVKDSSGNEDKVTIPITYTDKPDSVLKLKGNSKVYVALNSTYTDAGATYTDGCKNPVNDQLITENNVNTAVAGEYNVTYYTPNKDKKVSRKVIVYNPAEVVNENSTDKTIYLTFDDGPSVYTKGILDTLAKYNVKATFFVTHQFSQYIPLIAEEHAAGHVVAVHTYTHKWNIYSSVDAYLEDFNKMNDVIEQYTGQRSKIFRFPGGSSNTVSRKYSSGVVSAIAAKMTEDGYVYFDWDVSSNDAGGANESQVYNNVVNGAARCTKCVVLMHDIKKPTANQLDNILATLTSRGYKFGVLSPSSPTVHQRIAN